MQQWQSRTRRGAVSAVVLAFSLAFGYFVLEDTDPGVGAEDLVRAYLTAIRTGDTTTALDLVGSPPPPPNVHDDFLTGEAAAGDWTVESVAAVGGDSDDGASPTWMTVKFRVGVPGGTMVDGEFRTIWIESEDRWTIEAPFVTLLFPRTSLWYYDLNGVTVDVPSDTYSGTGNQPMYRVFPSVYRLYAGESELVEAVADPTALFPGSAQLAAGEGLSEPWLGLTDSGTAAAKQAVEAFIDGCVTGSGSTSDACPMSLNLDKAEVDDVRIDTLDEVSWTIESYPEPAFEYRSGVFKVIDRRLGVARVTAVDTSTDRVVTARCSVTGADLGVRIDRNGSMTVVPAGGGRAWAEEDFGTDIVWGRCER